MVGFCRWMLAVVLPLVGGARMYVWMGFLRLWRGLESPLRGKECVVVGRILGITLHGRRGLDEFLRCWSMLLDRVMMSAGGCGLNLFVFVLVLVRICALGGDQICGTGSAYF